MAEQNYIYKIFTDKLEKEIEQDFEKDYPYTKATFTINNPSFTQIVIRVFDRRLNYINTFVATEFDCRNAFEKKQENNLSEVHVDNVDIKRWYLRWMNKHFKKDGYETDFFNYRNKIDKEDLGIEQ